ncbi:MAG: 30S ribosomal protein S4 [Bacteroidetes bacterium ADurb.Bin141]|nr:MAG: 30S ribosomal protein S4 [Bacteroidetes bacterium OLB10]MBE7509305.1 30S ribosomal protein S4 [Bacteroidia bacterium]MBX3106370.1 30S ribosomal protein S4 [Bacteroidota bacterium]OQB64362.1 MAG: 30S ribosomal protein S4 [Bacteroidetes bacterium ADurb.Bin141]MCB0849523.1 30S ribosomal protein S4 [Bacteroidota bacterium]
MARYIGPKTKIARKFREPIFGPDKYFEKRSYPPGQHGIAKKRAKQSEYAVQLLEKQKVKYTYGILERQFSRIFSIALRKDGITGENLLKLMESRLDNVVFRFGIAPSRAGARQLVSHCHITVNGKVNNISSYILKPGDIVGVRERSKSNEVITDSLASRSNKYGWLEWDTTAMQGKFVTTPSRDEIPENIKEQLIVELYSK